MASWTSQRISAEILSVWLGEGRCLDSDYISILARRVVGSRTRLLMVMRAFVVGHDSRSAPNSNKSPYHLGPIWEGTWPATPNDCINFLISILLASCLFVKIYGHNALYTELSELWDPEGLACQIKGEHDPGCQIKWSLDSCWRDRFFRKTHPPEAV